MRLARSSQGVAGITAPRATAGREEETPRGSGYNPFNVCASSVGTTTGGRPCYYLFKEGNIPYEELESFTYLNYNSINKWCKKYNIFLDNILKTSNENKLKILLESWYKDKLLEKI